MTLGPLNSFLLQDTLRKSTKSWHVAMFTILSWILQQQQLLSSTDDLILLLPAAIETCRYPIYFKPLKAGSLGSFWWVMYGYNR